MDAAHGAEQAQRVAVGIPALVVPAVYTMDGITVAEVDCRDFGEFRRLPAAIRLGRLTMGRAGWNSDRGRAYYRTDWVGRVAYPTEVK